MAILIVGGRGWIDVLHLARRPRSHVDGLSRALLLLMRCPTPCRFALSQERSTQDKVARELHDAGLLAHGEQREPRGVSFADLCKLPYLEAVRSRSCIAEPSDLTGIERMTTKDRAILQESMEDL